MKHKKDFHIQKIGGEYILVPLGSEVVNLNGIIILNATGRFVWELLAEDRSVCDLAAAVTDRFDIDLERAHVDIQTFLDEITHLKLLEK